MKRWNGWGREDYHYELPPTAYDYLVSLVGTGCTSPDAALEEVVGQVPASRCPSHVLVSTDPEDRLRHACGQSVPDWVALRFGKIRAFPDGVAHPASKEDVAALLAYARTTGTRLIPYGGGSSVVGHINPPQDGPPVVTIDLTGMDRLLDLDKDSWLATIGAGAAGPHIEEQLSRHGYRLGHYPQSWEFSTLGGWIATRSSGQQSYYYGRIEELFAGGHVETFSGPMDLPPFPASAAGPDLRHLILGSEGRLGIITEAVVRVRPLPQEEKFFGVFFPSWEQGKQAMQQAAQASLPLSNMRLSNPMETETTLQLSGKETLVTLAHTGLSLIGYGDSRCLLIYGVTGSSSEAARGRRAAGSLFRRHGGFMPFELIGRMWEKSRFTSPYLRNTLWEKGYVLDTFETALPWREVEAYAADALTRVRSASESAGVPILIFAHLSHVYRDGASIYITYLFPRQETANANLEHWRKCKTESADVIVEHGGTISHQHGVGEDHAPYLAAEKGPVGMEILGDLCRSMDPQKLLNPGKLIADPDTQGRNK
jgi:alkyldihydroxyacetonephosphate synthase